MSTSFNALLTACMGALGDPAGGTWTRATVITTWAKEAMLAFPILRPMQSQLTVAGADSHYLALPAGFREVISVEYPISQEPPDYLNRKNHFDPDFFLVDTNYDVERNFASDDDTHGFSLSTISTLWVSKLLAIGEHLNVNYLSNHRTDVTDAIDSFISVPDEYVSIIIAYVLVKAYRERLGFYLRDPALYLPIINHTSLMVQRAEDQYAELVQAAVARYASSRTTPHVEADKFDRVY